MRLPNLQNALVEERKVTEYLLADERVEGKAAFFEAFGFSRARWDILRDALLLHAAANSVTATFANPHGTKHVVEGPLQTPDGRDPPVRSVWIIEKGADAPRLVTAYPL